MQMTGLEGKHVRLEPIDYRHADGLVAAAAGNQSIVASAWPEVKENLNKLLLKYK